MTVRQMLLARDALRAVLVSGASYSESYRLEAARAIEALDAMIEKRRSEKVVDR